MTGVWELELRRLRLEVDGESAEIGGIHQFALEKPSVWEVGVEPDAGVLWRSDAPLMLLLKQAKRGHRIRFVADYSATVEEKIDYGCSYWEYFLGNHDTPVLRKHTAYRCMEGEEFESDIYPVSYDEQGFHEVYFTAEKEDVEHVELWVSRDFLIFKDAQDGRSAEQVEEELQYIRGQYMDGEGTMLKTDGGIYLCGQVRMTLDQMQCLFKDVRNRSIRWLEMTLVPDRGNGNAAFAVVHRGLRNYRRDEYPYARGVGYCVF